MLFKPLTDPDGTPKRCHSHMFRDTFAVELLLAGVPIDQVSILLGHSSVNETEKHYASFVKARQEQLAQSARMARMAWAQPEEKRPATPVTMKKHVPKSKAVTVAVDNENTIPTEAIYRQQEGAPPPQAHRGRIFLPRFSQ